MSPEQLRGREVGTDSDVFSFGTVIYEMLTGIQPFRKDTHMDTASAILNEKPVDPSHLRPEIPRDVDRTIERMLAKTPEQRLSIKQVRAGLGEGRGPKAEIVSGRRLAWGGALAVLLLVLLAVIFSPQFRQNLAPGDPVPADKHLVILPFAFIGDESASRALCDGLVETLASKLTQLERFQGSLWVVPTSEVRSRTDLSVEAARKAFAVTLAVTGSWQQVSDRIRMTLNLVDARNLRQIESAVIDHRVGDPAGLQDKAVFQMARMLSLELQPRELGVLAAATPAQPRAYELYLQGRGFLQRYDKPESLNSARQAFAAAAELDPLFALAYAGLGEAFWKEYQSTRDTSFLQQAVEACRRALELDSQASAVNVTLGLVLQGTGEYEKAAQSFRKAIEIDPFNVEAYRGLGRTQESLGETEEAEKSYIQATQVRPESWSVFNRLGSFYYRQGRYEEARTQFERVIALTPDNPRGYNNLGSLLSVLQRPSEARRMFERSLQAEPTNSAYSNLATLYFRDGRYQDAARMYAKVLERGSKNYTITKNLAHAYHFSGEAEKALQTYARAAAQVEDLRRINPRDAKIMVDLAQLYALTDRPAKALELLRLSLGIAPEDVTILAVAFETYEQLGEREMALKWIEVALERGFKLSSIESNPTLQDLRSDQRYKALALSK